MGFLVRAPVTARSGSDATVRPPPYQALHSLIPSGGSSDSAPEFPPAIPGPSKAIPADVRRTPASDPKAISGPAYPYDGRRGRRSSRLPLIPRTHEDKLFEKNLTILCRQAVARTPQFTAGGFFTIDYSMLASMVGSLTANMIIILQFMRSNRNGACDTAN
ncbi:hypothetical protein WA026_002937 [Henosepilachna vigintioctopunctata]|uniref:Uncharacterized protein n=1 Tax=Henosepilachna vigintioctopunctata TaxID=420089 RepID=A0AAW1TPX5_9CUCU